MNTGGGRIRDGAISTSCRYPMSQKFESESPMVRPDFRWIKRLKQMTLATSPRTAQIVSVLHHYPRVAASLSPILSGDQLAKHQSCDAFRR
jgi:hypothetical protein